MTTGVTWDDIARFREAWPRALVLKGIQHPADAERAVALGVDGIWVSNHGGRQFDAAPASIDTVPAIAAAVGGRAKILYDGSSARASMCCAPWRRGPISASPGGPSCYSVAAIGEAGGDHATAAFMEETRGTFGQAGMRNVAEAAAATVLHPKAVGFDPVGNAAGRRKCRGGGWGAGRGKVFPRTPLFCELAPAACSHRGRFPTLPHPRPAAGR